MIDETGRIECEYRNLRVFTEPRRIGDINGDGLIDFTINVSGIFDNVPRIVLGTTVAGTSIGLNALDGSNGFAVVGGGHIIFPVGDVNGDSIDDIGGSMRTVLNTQFGISYFDTRLSPSAGARYEVIALRSDGERSAVASFVLEPGTTVTPTPGDEQPALVDLQAIVYSGTAAELFWTRPELSLQIVRTEVLRDGESLGTSPGNSFFDDTRTPGVPHSYTLATVDAQGVRSAAVTIETAGR